VKTRAHVTSGKRDEHDQQGELMSQRRNILNEVLEADGGAVAQRWIDVQVAATTFRSDRISKTELAEHSRRFMALLSESAASGSLDIQSPAWAGVRQLLEDLSVARARQGFSPSETAMFVFSLKDVLFDTVRERLTDDAGATTAAILEINQLLDRLGLFTTEVFQKGREQVIVRQQQELMELSTPVVTLWEGVLALPVIGTLDSARTQVVMESLLDRIVATGASIAIIDITGVPTVDTLTAQHLLKTIAAARLMGADCIISGIRPQIAQTIVHLGVELGSVVTKATLADAFAVALRRLGLSVARAPRPDRRREHGHVDASSEQGDD
jgi:rsbT co-antagonist protein RsbR